MNAILTIRSYVGPAIAAGTGTLAAIGTTCILPAVGFCAAGVKAGSIAAGVQASTYGADVPAGSILATLQSWGTTGSLAGTLGAAALPIGIVVAGGLSYRKGARRIVLFRYLQYLGFECFNLK